MSKKYFISIGMIISLALILYLVYFSKSAHSNLPLVAIANYGPHSSLQNSLMGFKDEMVRQGFKENQNIRYAIEDVNFNSQLISQMITQLKYLQPKVMVVMTTPVAQTAKNMINNIPLVFNSITDPVAAGLLLNKNQSLNNITGATDQQNLNLFLNFAKKLIPQAKTVGVLYSTSEANDQAMLEMLEDAAKKLDMKVLAIPVMEARDIPLNMQGFKNKADFIYVGVSGPIQPTLPAIVASARAMHIPVFNADSDAVKKSQVLGSYGVNYYQVGVNTANLVAEILRGKSPSELLPLYPSALDHHGFISRSQANNFKLQIPRDLLNSPAVTIVE